MKTNKLFTLALLSSVFALPSCDDIVDCGCDCSQPNITGWEILDKNKEKNIDGTVDAGTAIIIYGSNLSDITSITFVDKAAELQPAYMSDNQIVFRVPEGISKDCGAHIATKGCPTGFDTDILRVVVGPPCATMCDNEFAKTTLKVKGNNFFAPLQATFMDAAGQYSLVASTDNGLIKIDDQNSITITLPEGIRNSAPIQFLSNACKNGPVLSDFIFRDTTNLLATRDDEELNKFNGQKPDAVVTDEEGNSVGLKVRDKLVEKFNKKSKNTNGDFFIFHRDGADFVGLTYEPYNADANPAEDDPKYPTPFGVYSSKIVKEGMDPNDFAVKFEVLVLQDNPMQGDGLSIGFFDAVAPEDFCNSRRYCAYWQPSKAVFAKDKDNVWDENSLTCDAWSCPDWITVSVPMSDIMHNFEKGKYTTNPQDNRRVTDKSDNEFAYYGDAVAGLPFFAKYTKINDLFGGDSPLDLGDTRCSGLAIIMGSYDCPFQSANGRHPYVAVDNVRIVPKDGNGGYWEYFNWGVPTREFYTAPNTTCK